MPRSDSTNDNSGGLVARSGDGDNDGDNDAPYTITEISGLLKRTVEDRFGHVRLRGELSGVKRAASGHLYCALKDEKAVIDAVMWRGNSSRLSFVPEDGLEVVASGKLTTYAGRSKYQIVVDRMEVAGEGALLALLEKTRRRLAQEGLFAPERKRDLPYLPRVIGVVTSPTGAVIRDILHRLADRFPSHVLVWPVLVQGAGSAEQVAAAIRGFDAISASEDAAASGGPPTSKGAPTNGDAPRPDVLIVARGGGSTEDLWGFNEEVVVRAIAECAIPVISAIGHETDTTLADHAADRRAPTPTAAAEMAVPVRSDLAASVADFAMRQKRAIARPVMLGRERLEARVQRLPVPDALLQPQAQRLDDLAERLRRALADRAAQGRERLSKLRFTPAMLQRAVRDAHQRLSSARLAPALIQRRLDSAQAGYAAAARIFASLDPDRVLARGYVRVTDAGGRTLMDSADAASKDALKLRFRDGMVDVAPYGKGQGDDGQGDDEQNDAAQHKMVQHKTVLAPSKRKKARPKPAQPRQDDLFS